MTGPTGYTGIPLNVGASLSVSNRFNIQPGAFALPLEWFQGAYPDYNNGITLVGDVSLRVPQDGMYYVSFFVEVGLNNDGIALVEAFLVRSGTNETILPVTQYMEATTTATTPGRFSVTGATVVPLLSGQGVQVGFQNQASSTTSVNITGGEGRFTVQLLTTQPPIPA